MYASYALFVGLSLSSAAIARRVSSVVHGVACITKKEMLVCQVCFVKVVDDDIDVSH